MPQQVASPIANLDGIALMANTIFLMLCSAGELFFVYALVRFVKEGRHTRGLFSKNSTNRIPSARVNAKIIEISVRQQINQQSAAR